ncbi:MAG: hypothetical protein IJ996_06595 [Clostridia bacterium]|nr:hypothetical protein [Clostridia bacterium]
MESPEVLSSTLLSLSKDESLLESPEVLSYILLLSNDDWLEELPKLPPLHAVANAERLAQVKASANHLRNLFFITTSKYYKKVRLPK